MPKIYNNTKIVSRLWNETILTASTLNSCKQNQDCTCDWERVGNGVCLL